MILPTGHEETELRRYPWVTTLLVLACGAAFAYTWLTAAGIDERVQSAHAETFEYWSAHPYLALDEKGAAALFPELGLVAREHEIGGRRRAYPHRVFEFQLTMDQPELDRKVAALQAVLDERVLHRFGLTPADPTALGWLGHMFLHDSWFHLLGNMLFLFLAGYILEEVWGRPLFVTLYVASGLASAALFTYLYPESSRPLVGASGAVAGLMGAFMVRFGSTKIRFYYFVYVFHLFRGTFWAPAWLMLSLWLGSEVLSAWLMDRLAAPGEIGVAQWAHLSGFGVSAAMAIAIWLAGIEKRYLHPKLESKVTFVQNPAVDEALALRERGDDERAFFVLQAALRRDSANSVVAMALWDVAVPLGRAEEAAPDLERMFRKDVQAGRADGAFKLFQELEQHARGARLDSMSLVRLGALLAQKERVNEATQTLTRALPRRGDSLPGPVAVRLARTALPIDPGLAARASAAALAAPDLDPRLRAELESMSGGVPPPGADRRASTPSPEAATRREPESGDGADAFDRGTVDLSTEEPEAETPSPAASSEPDPFEHGSVDLSTEEPATEEPEAEAPASPAPAPDPLEHGAVDLADEGEDAQLELAEPRPTGTDATTPVEFDEFEFNDEDEGGAGFLTDPDLEKDED